MISSDLGVKISSQIVEELRKSKILDPTVDKIKQIIKKKLLNIFYPLEKALKIDSRPYIHLIVGVNGVGKTATVGKIANKVVTQGKNVGLVAADTFRAAAKEQLKIWSEDKSNFCGEENSIQQHLHMSPLIEQNKKN